MKKQYTLAEDDLQLFRQTVVCAKPIPQDRVTPSPPPRTKTALPARRLIQEQVAVSFYFPMSSSRCCRRGTAPPCTAGRQPL